MSGQRAKALRRECIARDGRSARYFRRYGATEGEVATARIDFLIRRERQLAAIEANNARIKDGQLRKIS